jgi:phosphoribosylamine--glycine ligase
MGDLLYAVAKGKQAKLKCKDAYGIVVAIAVPPFPFPPKKNVKGKNRILNFLRPLKQNEVDSIHFEEISKRINKNGSEEHYWAGEFGYAKYITASAKTIPAAQKKIKHLLKAIHLPDMIYRTDIGDRVHRHDIPKLKKWGWV